MQDATAQMAMLQFMQSGRPRDRAAATIHCDHLVQARDGAAKDLPRGLAENAEVFSFLSSAARKYGSDSGRRAAASSTRSSSRITRSPAAS